MVRKQVNTLLIDSLYINNSGGKVLLDYLVSELEKKNIEPYYLFDLRCINDYKKIPNQRKLFLKASLWNRHNFYKQNKDKFSSIFCFGNIPPTIKLKVPVYTYFHNVSILKAATNYGTKERILKYLKRKFIEKVSKNTSLYIVQSSFVKRLLCDIFKITESNCIVFPFFKEYDEKTDENVKKIENGFLYVSNGNTHKNHENLLTSWEQLAERGFYPELHLTITSQFDYLIKRIENLNNKGFNILNHGFINPIELYKKSKFVIYPSLIESFGLGLIEGIKFNCDLVTSNREYVYEVVKPSFVFDPENPTSIANAVIDILNKKDYSKSEIIVENKIDELIQFITNAPTHSRPKNR
jgi:glycosyltransferase involved in cell wall biosynthesis